MILEGLGSDRFILDRMSVYGRSKGAAHYFTKVFDNEIKGGAVQIGLLSPGMVVTDLFQETVADDVETVAVFLAEKMLASHKSFERIQWLTKQKVIFRLLFGSFRRKNYWS
ncbi:Rossmann-fold NAD(P)-binding domain-containing protein [Chlorobium phaeobacteroides]|uniref:hypothetical protein n=1 Tax=Chlorobium phaeobacteroides TaxID=1096 RepID=UPI0003231284|nr:hypothetical protein [Chlorobium phaeobacteroides]MBV5326269.1 hypothetical protein [Chlorobium sp.]